MNDIITLARLFRHEWRDFAYCMATGAMTFGALAAWTLTRGGAA
jgi:hypothetical protein